MNTSIESVLYTSKTLTNGEHPIMLRLSKDGKRKYISLHISLDAKYWDFQKNRPKRNCPDKDKINSLIERKIKEYQEQVIDFKTNEREYTLTTLIDKTSKPTIKQTTGEYLDEYIERLTAEKRIGNAKTFKELRTSLTSFCGSLDFYFIDIDTGWLKRYEQWLRTVKKFSENSIGIRFRSLRALYNSAVKDNLVRQANYPFNDFKVSTFKEATAKRALSKTDIKRLMAFDTEEIKEANYPTPFLTLAKDLFLFSYFSCGINLTDILHVRYCDIIDSRLTFKRQKTGKLISLRLQPDALNIIEKYHKEKPSPLDYVFPVLNRKIHITPEQQYGRVQRVNKRINKYLKQIGEHLELSIPLTTYVARHSFATVLKRSGVNVALISEALGHSDITTTQIYLDSFENEQLDEAMSNLL